MSRLKSGRKRQKSEMRNEKLVIVDLTCNPARISVTTVGPLRIETIQAPGHAWRVALRQTDDGLLTLTSDEAAEARDDERTMVFDDAISDLPRIDDLELQAHLMRACWNALYRLLAQRDLLSDLDKAVCFMTFRHDYQTPLLER